MTKTQSTRPAHSTSVNGVRLTPGVPTRFTLLTLQPTTMIGVVTGTGSGAVKVRLADGSTDEICQSVISRLAQDLTDAELILFEFGISA